MNLAINARDAMPRGGSLAFETRNVDVTGPEVAASGLVPGRYVCLEVRDTGSGMSEETLAHIFEPFFTTKESGHGTGLGLPTVYGIVLQSGGHIVAESVPGVGTTMRVYLPRADAPAASAEAKAAARAAAGHETLLLVEDEEVVRTLMRESLEDVGYSVIEAADGNAALLAFRDQGSPIDLLVTDLVLPGMNGAELARQLRAIAPGLKTLYVSGYPGPAGQRQLTLEPNAAFLQKPFTRQVLTEKVRQAIDRGTKKLTANS
jgi:two-component system, cell cycle sensor histidine kinase and response regulator CckA